MFDCHVLASYLILFIYFKVPADLNQQRSEKSVQAQGQCQPQAFASSPSVKKEMAVSSNELSLASPGHMVTSGAIIPVEVDNSQIKASIENNQCYTT